MKRIYLDNNATTALDPRVLSVMQEEFLSGPANPSSTHALGRKAKEKLTKARQIISHFFSVKPNELIFTSGASESINFLLHGFARAKQRKEIISSDIEHPAVYQTLKSLEKEGSKVTFLSAGLRGAINPVDVEKAINSETALIVLSAVNSETGVKNPIEEIGKIALQNDIPFVVDGVALLGKELFTFPKGVSAFAFSSHKCHGPQGVGLVWLKSGLSIDPLIKGGPQEFSKRAGTENIAGISGFAKAIELLATELPQATHRMEHLRDQLETQLKKSLPDIVVNGLGPRIANTSNISFPGIDGEILLMQLDLAGIAVSLGSACSSGALEPSRILLNMGIPRELAKNALRFSLSRFTTSEDIDYCINQTIKIVNYLKKI